jgi:hypothetical protein
VHIAVNYSNESITDRNIAVKNAVKMHIRNKKTNTGKNGSTRIKTNYMLNN